ncbi:Ras- protein Rab-2A [Kappamyces sp. JEL0680]|nr:Ras- protein Rab-2A [Kappamyces sp. JEL0680]
MTRKETFAHIQSWLEDGTPPLLTSVSMHGNDEIKSILVANKCDQESKRQVSREEGMEFAKRHGLLYIETSAKSGKNVEEVPHAVLIVALYDPCPGGLQEP